VLAACGGHSSPPARSSPTATAAATAAAAPALCGPLRAHVVARVSIPGLSEASGLVLSRGLLWTHDDSGGPATLFALSTRGKLVRELPLAGATNVDWEDIAARAGTLYVGDIGDNARSRPEIAVYRGTQRIALRYPDGPHDAEALLVDGRTLVIVTKSLSGEAGVYTARGPGTLHRAGTLQLGIGEPVTGADATSGLVVLRTYDRAFVWTRKRGESIAHALRGDRCTAGAELIEEGQGESIALAGDGRSFYTLPEGARPALRQYVSQH
jgi:hypothetical protein